MGQIANHFTDGDDLALDFHIAPQSLRLSNGLQERRLAVPLFADEAHFHPRLEGKTKILQQDPEVFGHYQGKVFDDKHLYTSA